MAKKNVESNKTPSSEKGRVRGPKASTKSPSSTPRLTPVRVRSSESSPRSSPGLGAGHYAGCKWTEPPLPSALPLPPQHWMQAAPHSIVLPFRKPKSEQNDISSQLKVLLKVQA